VSCEGNSIGATGVGPLLPGRTVICIGGRIAQPDQSEITSGSDYAGLPSSLLWPYQTVTTIDGKSKRKKWGNSFRGTEWGYRDKGLLF